MSKYFENIYNLRTSYPQIIGSARKQQPTRDLINHFDMAVLHYLSERVINHLADSLNLDILWKEQFKERFNDFSFFTAPAYKAFEGFLFQIAKDLNLPSSGNPKFVGTYFDEEKVDETIDNLLKELGNKTKESKTLDNEEKMHIKDMVNEMKRFLHYYRHTPAHFDGEPIDTIDKARQNILSMYRIISETVKTLMKAGLIKIDENIH
ncbi:MAG: hypothetical protein ABSF55_00450 [Candidatus Staskawiczbacteria bacterium]|jgi:hypothetical protein